MEYYVVVFFFVSLLPLADDSAAMEFIVMMRFFEKSTHAMAPPKYHVLAITYILNGSWIMRTDRSARM